MNQAAVRYLKAVKRKIHCSRSLKTEFLCQLEDEVCLYCDDHHDADFSSLAERFGTPEDVAKDFVSELGDSAVTWYAAVKERLSYLVAAIIILAIVGIGIHTYIVQHALLDGAYVESITYEGDAVPYVTGPTYSAEFSSDE